MSPFNKVLNWKDVFLFIEILRLKAQKKACEWLISAHFKGRFVIKFRKVHFSMYLAYLALFWVYLYLSVYIDMIASDVEEVESTPSIL